MSLIPVFSMANITRTINNFSNEKERRGYMAFIYAGEQFVNRARERATFTDRTGNLRNSIGYAIAKGGRILKFSCPARGYEGDEGTVNGGQEAKNAAMQTAREVAAKYKTGLILIGFAGMEYAASVESRGYDVISGYMPETEKDLMNALQDAGLR
jgi:hypothetical protein